MTPIKKEPDLSTYPGRFAARLRELRAKAGLSQTELAEALGVRPHTVSQWETATHSPGLKQFPALAKVLRLKKIKDLLPSE